MNSAQTAAFEGANTGASAFSAADLTLLITGVIGTTVLLWFAWVTMSCYRSWGKQKITNQLATEVILRTLFICVIIIVIASL